MRHRLPVRRPRGSWPSGTSARKATTLLLLALGLLGAPGLLRAQEDDEGREIHQRVFVLQPLKTVVGGSLELTPTVGYVANDLYFHQIALGGSLAFHVTETWSAGLSFSQYLTAQKPFYDEVQRDYAVFPQNVKNAWSAGAHVAFAPIRSKLAFYPFAVLRLRLYVKAGVGVLKTSTSGIRPAGLLGGGLGFLFAKYLGMSLELADQMYVETYPGEDSFKNQFLVTLGVNVFIPVL